MARRLQLRASLASLSPDITCAHAGIVLWEIATGETPVRGRLREVEVPAEGPQALADLIARCTGAAPGQPPGAAAAAAPSPLRMEQQGAAAAAAAPDPLEQRREPAGAAAEDSPRSDPMPLSPPAGEPSDPMPLERGDNSSSEARSELMPLSLDEGTVSRAWLLGEVSIQQQQADIPARRQRTKDHYSEHL